MTTWGARGLVGARASGEQSAKAKSLREPAETGQAGADETDVDLDNGPEHEVSQIVGDVGVARRNGHDLGKSDDGDDADEETEQEHAGQDQSLAERDVETPDVGDRHEDEDEIDNDVR